MHSRLLRSVDGLSWYGLCLAALVLAIAPLVAYAAFVLAPWGNAYVVTSGSMEPSIDAGSIAFVVETGTYERGDVVTFERAGEVITHRIVDRTDGGYVTAGDANAVPDDWLVSDAQIVGTVVYTVPYYGSILQFTRTPHGYILFVLLPGTVLLARELGSLSERL